MQLHLTLKYLCVTLILSVQVNAQMGSVINYLNAANPGKMAQVFAPGVLSTNAYEHSAPAFSPDGKTVVWAVMKMPTYQTYLVEMNFINNKWQKAQIPSFCDTMANEVYPNFSPDGTTLFFSSNRSMPNSSQQYQTLWSVKKTRNGWSAPQPLDTALYKKDLFASSTSKNGERYFTVGPHGTSDWNIYVTDRFGKSQILPPPINSKGYEDGPFIASDGSYLIFESDRPTGVEGNVDLYITFRKKDKSWTNPLNMGTDINTTFAERFASVSPDGKYFFFGRNTGSGFDIYWMDAAVLKKLKKQAVDDGLFK